jgi:hypothetical protein
MALALRGLMMNRPPFVRFALLLAILGALALRARSAGACQPPPPPGPCAKASVGFAANAVVPANVPGLPVSLAYDSKEGVTLLADSWRLVQEDGTRVPTTFAGGRMVPKEPLLPDRTYRIVHPVGCQAEPVAEHPFRTGPARPISPLSFGEGTAGTVTVTTSVGPYTDYFAPCGGPSTIPKAAVAHVRFSPSQGARAWAAVADLDVEIDRFNQGWTLGRSRLAVQETNPIRTYYANCAGGQPEGNLEPGKHKIYVWFFVGDERFVSPSSAEFELSCDTTPPPPPDAGADVLEADGGADRPDATSADLRPSMEAPDAAPPTPRAPSDATTSEPPVSTPPVAEPASCAFARHPGAPAGWWVLALPGIALVVRARRREITASQASGGARSTRAGVRR